MFSAWVPAFYSAQWIFHIWIVTLPTGSFLSQYSKERKYKHCWCWIHLLNSKAIQLLFSICTRLGIEKWMQAICSGCSRWKKGLPTLQSVHQTFCLPSFFFFSMTFILYSDKDKRKSLKPPYLNIFVTFLDSDYSVISVDQQWTKSCSSRSCLFELFNHWQLRDLTNYCQWPPTQRAR